MANYIYNSWDDVTLDGASVLMPWDDIDAMRGRLPERFFGAIKAALIERGCIAPFPRLYSDLTNSLVTVKVDSSVLPRFCQ